MILLTHLKTQISENAWVCEDRKFRTIAEALKHASVGDLIFYSKCRKKYWAKITQEDLEKGAGAQTK